MLNARNTAVTVLLLATGLTAASQDIKLSGLSQLWYTQMLDNNLRLNERTGPYQFPSQFAENGFYIRRTEIKLAGKANDNLDWEIMVDPTRTGDMVLQDLSFKYKLPHRFEVRAGQFKAYQTLEGMASSSEILFAERSMLGRQFGDVRDRGIAASVGFGDSKGFNGRFHTGFFQGAAKNNDANAQKDVIARLDMNYGKKHYFGLYTLQGSTDLTDKGGLKGLSFGKDGDIEIVPLDDILENKDKTTNIGGFYRFQDEKFHASLEFITGLVGRRYPSLGTSDGNVNSNRKHLDQNFLGYVGTFGYTFDKHTLVARYDYMNYNAGDDWYSANSPYKTANGDFTPEYTEITFGYIYALMPGKMKNANIKANYIMRSKNFMRPTQPGQTGEQGGDSFVVCLQFGF